MRDRNLLERRYAEFYHLFSSDFRQDAKIYVDIAGKYPGPVLEVGCGTGRVTREIAEAGHEIHACDTSRPMLEFARRNLADVEDKVRLFDFDLRSQAMHDRFGVVIVSLHAFNFLIDVEEQRLFLRHLTRACGDTCAVAVDLFCPLSMVRPEGAEDWREIERVVGERHVEVRDRREMLTPLLERRTQVFSIDGGPPGEFVTHRRYVPPIQAASLLSEAGFDTVRWMRNYDPTTLSPVDASERPDGPFMIIAERS